MILINGATGSVGRELTKQLSARNVPFRAMIRSMKDVQASSSLEGAETVVGDFDKPDTLAHALQGAERAFLLTNSSERAETKQLTFVDTARRAGVKHIVKLSQWAASPNSAVRFLRYHADVERKIRESDGVHLSSSELFMQGLLAFREKTGEAFFGGSIPTARPFSAIASSSAMSFERTPKAVAAKFSLR